MLFVFAIAAFVQISLWIGIRVGISRASRNARDQPPQGAPQPTSVVVAARDGGADLASLLPLLADQRTTGFEVIVVDDGSSDETAKTVEAFAARDRRFKLVSNPHSTRGKKGAIQRGVNAAAHEIIVQTDVDCRPGPGWLGAHAHTQSVRPGVVAGYGPYAPAPSLLNSAIRFETLSTAMLTAASVGLGHPYMAVGRNLSYSRAAVEAVETSLEGSSLLSGDDDLFVQAASRAGFPVRYLFDPASYVESGAPESLRSWIRQKRRHFSAGRAYSRWAQVVLALFHGSSLLCWIAPLVLGWSGLVILAAKLAIQWSITASASSIFQEPGLTAWLPLLDLVWVMLTVFVGPVGVLFPPKEW